MSSLICWVEINYNHAAWITEVTDNKLINNVFPSTAQTSGAPHVSEVIDGRKISKPERNKFL